MICRLRKWGESEKGLFLEDVTSSNVPPATKVPSIKSFFQCPDDCELCARFRKIMNAKQQKSKEIAESKPDNTKHPATKEKTKEVQFADQKAEEVLGEGRRKDVYSGKKEAQKPTGKEKNKFRMVTFGGRFEPDRTYGRDCG
jgi:hypothetical protein